MFSPGPVFLSPPPPCLASLKELLLFSSFPCSPVASFRGPRRKKTSVPLLPSPVIVFLCGGGSAEEERPLSLLRRRGRRGRWRPRPLRPHGGQGVEAGGGGGGARPQAERAGPLGLGGVSLSFSHYDACPFYVYARANLIIFHSN